MAKNKSSLRHYSVYVIRLDPKVLKIPEFAKENPDYVKGKPCVYVGMTWHTPRVRLGKHLLGIKACKLVTKYGLGLMPTLYNKYNLKLMSKAKAAKREVKLAKRLRECGYAVWQR